MKEIFPLFWILNMLHVIRYKIYVSRLYGVSFNFEFLDNLL